MLYPAQACILLIVSISALEFNICFSWFFFFLRTQYLINQCTIKRVLKFNGFEVVPSIEACQIFSVLLVILAFFGWFSSLSLLLLYKASFCDQTEKFPILIQRMFLPSKDTNSIPYQDGDSYFWMLPNLLKGNYGSVHLTSFSSLF